MFQATHIRIREQRLHRQNKPTEESTYEEWTLAIISQLRRLYDSINLNQTTINIAKAAAESKKWQSSDERRRFLNRWNYILSLIRYQYAEGLIDQRTFLRWTLDWFKSANFDQVCQSMHGWVVFRLASLLQLIFPQYRHFSCYNWSPHL